MENLVLAEQQSLLRIKRNQPFYPGILRIADDCRFFEINKAVGKLLVLRGQGDETRPPLMTLDSNRTTYYWVYGLCRFLMNQSTCCSRRARKATRS
jgi:hypothetical protein